jgi:hypothetical protein
LHEDIQAAGGYEIHSFSFQSAVFRQDLDQVYVTQVLDIMNSLEHFTIIRTKVNIS